jgi:hypothetical protein
VSNPFPEISVTLQSIVCGGASEGSDDLYVIWQADGGVPHRYPTDVPHTHTISPGQTWTINQVMTFTRDLQVTIYDQDVDRLPSSSDYLMSAGYTNVNIPPMVTVANYNGAVYALNVAVNG